MLVNSIIKHACDCYHPKSNPPQTAGSEEGFREYGIVREGTQVDYDMFELLSSDYFCQASSAELPGMS